MITNKKELVEGCYYWLFCLDTESRDIGYWDGYQFQTCHHADYLFFLEVTNIYAVCPENH